MGNDIIDYAQKNIGSKDSSIAGTNRVLLEGLKELYDTVLERNNLKDPDISEIFASGMVTSPFGIKEVPHLKVPVSLQDLRDNIFYHDEDLFSKANRFDSRSKVPDSDTITTDNILEVNSMRGEEVEIFGLLSTFDDKIKSSSAAVLVPGSHTQIAYVRDQKITDLISTMSGELFHAISSHTIISSSIEKDIPQCDKNMVEKAFNMLRQYGFNKTVYLINTMQIFHVADTLAKTSFLDGAIFGGDIICLERYFENKWQDIDHVIVYANKTIAEIYYTLLEIAGLNIEITIVEKSKQKDFAVRGFIEVMKAIS